MSQEMSAKRLTARFPFFSFPLLARTGESSREAVTIRSSWPEEKKEERKVSSLAIRR